MTGISDAIGIAAAALLVLMAFALPFRPPNTCTRCNAHVPRRHIPQHYLDHHTRETR